jgi:hypothetical protein
MPVRASTTIRVSRHTHALLASLAAEHGRSITELVEDLAEQARRDDLLRQYAARLTALAEDPAERAALDAERAWLDADAGATLASEPPYPL